MYPGESGENVIGGKEGGTLPRSVKTQNVKVVKAEIDIKPLPHVKLREEGAGFIKKINKNLCHFLLLRRVLIKNFTN